MTNYNKIWGEMKLKASQAIQGLEPKYTERLLFEIKEIEKQEASAYWVRLYSENFKYETNKNGLVLPWALKMTSIDPLLEEHKIIRQTDMPDIDLDCLPDARDKIKAYITEKYGEDFVCSVGAWSTYKFKLAIQDTARAYNSDLTEAMKVTKSLPDDVDDLKDGGKAPCIECDTKHDGIVCPKCGSEETDGITIGQLIRDLEELKIYNSKYPEIVAMAVRLVGRIKTQSKHAGGVVISDRKLFGSIPMALIGSGEVKHWSSEWSEGMAGMQLSTFGYAKWDVLGLRTLKYVHECCKMIERNWGYKFNIMPWEGMNPETKCMGFYYDENGEKVTIKMDDGDAIKMADDLRVETIFQFETDVQRGVLTSHVKSFDDLRIFNAMGHPGPIAMIPEYVRRRDDISQSWREGENPEMAELLASTHGIIIYQEQLQAVWQRFAGFTAPEAEAARKAVAKKKADKLKPVKEQWLKEASKTLGKRAAEEWWERMETFGRYAFNASHSVAYMVMAYWCLWLKSHFPEEWWATVMSYCDHDRLIRYMNVARMEGAKFGAINVERLTSTFSVDPKTRVITPGLLSLKGIGKKTAEKLTTSRSYTDIDDFIMTHGKQKSVMERLILLGAFNKYHKSIKGTWMWYQYKYCTGKDITVLKEKIRTELLKSWTPDKIDAERKRQIDTFKKDHPKRKLPAKIANWMPKPHDDRESIMALFDEYTAKEILEFEKQYLGYYWHSPMTLYKTSEETTINEAKEHGIMEVVIDSLVVKKTKKGNSMGRLSVTDGLQTTNVVIWQDQLDECKEYLKPGVGVKLYVTYDEHWNSFTLSKGSMPIMLHLTDSI